MATSEVERPVRYKDPNASLLYGFDWSDWLEAGETISSSDYTVTSGITLASESNTTTTTAARLTGGTTGRAYTLTNTIVTSAGNTAVQSMTIKVISR